MSDYKSYKSSVYDELDNEVTRKLKLPDGLLHSIRLNGERSNADQVSKDGAKTVYQFIPSTRKAILDKYGVDVYLNPKNAAMGAGLLLNESLKRNNGDTHAAVSEYHGGTDRKNWGTITKSYANRVLSALVPTANADELSSEDKMLQAMDSYHATKVAPTQSATNEDDLLSKMDAWNAQNNHPHPTQEQIDAAKNHNFKDDLQQTLSDNPIAAKMAAFADPLTSLYQGTKQLFGADNKQDIENNNTIREANPMSALAGNVAAYSLAGAAAPVVNTVKGAAGVGAVTGFLNPTESTGTDGLIQRAENASIGAGAGAGGVMLSNGASKYIANAKADKLLQQSQNATRDASLTAARDAGYVVTPSLADGGKIAKLVEGASGSARMARTAMDTNQKITNNLANEYLGLPKGTSLSDGVLDSLKSPHNAVYEQVANLPDTVIRQQSVKSLGTGNTATKDVVANGRELLDKLKEARDVSRSAWKGFNSGTANNPTELLKTAKNADTLASKIELDLEQMASKNGQPDLVQSLRSSRKELAKIHTIDKVMNETTGDVDAIALAKLAKKGVPVDGAAKKIANFGRAYPKIARVPADGNSAPITAVDAGLVSGGIGAGNPIIASLPIARVAGRSAILSSPVQNAMANKSYAISPTQQFIESILASKYAPLGITGGVLQQTK